MGKIYLTILGSIDSCFIELGSWLSLFRKWWPPKQYYIISLEVSPVCFLLCELNCSKDFSPRWIATHQTTWILFPPGPDKDTDCREGLWSQRQQQRAKNMGISGSQSKSWIDKDCWSGWVLAFSTQPACRQSRNPEQNDWMDAWLGWWYDKQGQIKGNLFI